MQRARPLEGLVGFDPEGLPLSNYGALSRFGWVYPDGLEALRLSYSSDAMCCQYSIPGVEGYHPRVNKKALPQLKERGEEPQLHWLLVDVDNPGHRTWDFHPAITIEAALSALPEPYNRALWYATRHGYRLVYGLSKPLLAGQAEPKIRGLIELLQDHGIGADPDCKDWTRLFRMPYATAEGQPLRLPARLEV
jgi:hypothetical protein